MSFKKCPFCREEIKTSGTSCPNCGRVFIEVIRKPDSIGSTHPKPISQKTPKSLLNFWGRLRNLTSKIGNKFKRKERIYTYQFDKWKRYKRIIFILVGVAVIILIANLANNSDSDSNKNNLITPPLPTSQPPTVKSNLKPPQEYVSLPNGTIINSDTLYLDGLGELKIDNGTDMDALAKLVKSYPHKSVYTVYIKAKSIYKITGISDGYYDLYFAHGRDWDRINQKFLVNTSYSKFEDGFDFVTKDEYLSDSINTRYTIFEVTLHPVFGGSAETDSVSENEFNQF